MQEVPELVGLYGDWDYSKGNQWGMTIDLNACIGCGACVAACPNSAAQLFTSAKVAHLNLLPQGQPERYTRVVAMVEEMERFFGSCTNHGECEKACPKEISIDFIAYMNRDYLKAKIKKLEEPGAEDVEAEALAMSLRDIAKQALDK